MLKILNKKNDKNYSNIFLKKSDKYNFFIKENMIEIEFNVKEKNFEIYNEFLKCAKKIKNNVMINFKEIDDIKLLFLRALDFVNYNFKISNHYNNINEINIVLEDIENNEFKKIISIFESINATRNLQDLPANICTPEYFESVILNRTKEIENLSIKVLNKNELTKINMNLFLSVNKGSLNEPRFIILEYRGNKSSDEFEDILVGKGITMDTGGYSLKSGLGQQEMKFDMSGAAIVANVLIAIAKNKIKKNFVALCPLTENCIGNGSTLMGDVINSYSQKTIEIKNTDAEGRLILADSISYAVKNYKFKNILTIATLTGLVKKALGEKITGCFSNNQNLFFEYENILKKNGDLIWLLPIQKENRNNLKSKIADYANIGKSNNYGSGNAAAFLELFVEKNNWLHFDIAGTAVNEELSTAILVYSLINKNINS